MNTPAALNSAQGPGCLRIIKILATVVAVFFAFLGFVFLCVGIGFYAYTARFAETARPAEGVVIELERSDSGTTWCPVVEYITHQGKTVRFQSRVCSSPPRYLRGESVDLLYAEDNPKNAQINDGSLYLFGYVFAGVGGVFFLLGSTWLVIVFVRKRRRGKTRPSSTVS